MDTCSWVGVLGVLFQIAGGAVTAWGLATTWARYNDQPSPSDRVRAAWRRLFPRHEVVVALPTTAQGRSAVDTIRMRDRATVERHGLTDAERITVLESQVQQLRDALDTTDEQLRDYVDQRVAETAEEAAQRVASVAASIPEQTREVALDGLGLAAYGVLLALVGTYIGGAALVCPAGA